MYRKTGLLTAVVIVLLVASMEGLGWGFWAHKRITEEALKLLPPKMAPFFEASRQDLINRSVEPDVVRREDSLEQYNHFLDFDYYGEYPFLDFPRSYNEAVQKFGEDTVRVYGLLPWKIAEFTDRLSTAMKSGHREKIVEAAVYLAHYVEDAHVPLHTALNYDGQLTDQKGIHSRFESRIPEMYGSRYTFELPDRIEPVDDPLAHAFAIILESHVYVDSILDADRGAKNRVPPEKLTYVVEKDGRQSVRYTDEYYEEFNLLLADLPRRRAEAAAVAVARYWYTAWLQAGEPVL